MNEGGRTSRVSFVDDQLPAHPALLKASFSVPNSANPLLQSTSKRPPTPHTRRASFNPTMATTLPGINKPVYQMTKKSRSCSTSQQTVTLTKIDNRRTRLSLDDIPEAKLVLSPKTKPCTKPSPDTNSDTVPVLPEIPKNGKPPSANGVPGEKSDKTDKKQSPLIGLPKS